VACGDATMEAYLKSRLQMGALKNTHLHLEAVSDRLAQSQQDHREKASSGAIHDEQRIPHYCSDKVANHLV
jgi:hypothetical protein